MKCFSLNHKVVFLPSPSGSQTVKLTYTEFLNAKFLRGEKKKCILKSFVIQQKGIHLPEAAPFFNVPQKQTEFVKS